MKKFFAVLLLALFLALPIAACAAEAEVRVYLNGQPLSGCFQQEEQLYLPVSSVLEPLGLAMEWDAASQKVSVAMADGSQLYMYVDKDTAERVWPAGEQRAEEFVCVYGFNDPLLLRQGSACASVETLAFLLQLNADKLDSDVQYLYSSSLVWQDNENAQVFLLDLISGMLLVREQGQPMAEARQLALVEDASLQELNRLWSQGEAYMAVETTAAGNYLLDCWAAALPGQEQGVSAYYFVDALEGRSYAASCQGLGNGRDNAPQRLRLWQNPEDFWLNGDLGLWHVQDAAPAQAVFYDTAAMQAAVLGREQTRPVHCYWTDNQRYLLLGDKQNYVFYDLQKETGLDLTPLLLTADVRTRAEALLQKSVPGSFNNPAALAEFWQGLGRSAELPGGTSYPSLCFSHYNAGTFYFSLALTCYQPDGSNYAIHNISITLPFMELTGGTV